MISTSITTGSRNRSAFRAAASFLVIGSLVACAVATRDPNRMVATRYREIPPDTSFVVVKADDSISEGLELFEDVLNDAFVDAGFKRAPSPDSARLAVIYAFECLKDVPKSARDPEAEVSVTHLKISVLNLTAVEGLKRGAPFWAATGSTLDSGCNPTQAGLWLVPRMFENLGQSVDPARALVH